MSLTSDLLRHVQDAISGFDPKRGGAQVFKQGLIALRPQPLGPGHESYRRLVYDLDLFKILVFDLKFFSFNFSCLSSV